MAYLTASAAMISGVYISRSFIDCNLFFKWVDS